VYWDCSRSSVSVIKDGAGVTGVTGVTGITGVTGVTSVTGVPKCKMQDVYRSENAEEAKVAHQLVWIVTSLHDLDLENIHGKNVLLVDSR
jgi:hypothetical protein